MTEKEYLSYIALMMINNRMLLSQLIKNHILKNGPIDENVFADMRELEKQFRKISDEFFEKKGGVKRIEPPKHNIS